MVCCRSAVGCVACVALLQDAISYSRKKVRDAAGTTLPRQIPGKIILQAQSGGSVLFGDDGNAVDALPTLPAGNAGPFLTPLRQDVPSERNCANTTATVHVMRYVQCPHAHLGMIQTGGRPKSKAARPLDDARL